MLSRAKGKFDPSRAGSSVWVSCLGKTENFPPVFVFLREPITETFRPDQLNNKANIFQLWCEQRRENSLLLFFFSRINNLSSLVQNWYPYSNVCVCVCMKTFIFHCGFFPWTETLPIPNSQSAPPLDHPTWKMTNSSSTKKFSGPHRRGTWFRPGWVSFNGIFRPSGSLWIWTTNVYIWKSFPPPHQRWGGGSTQQWSW